MGDYARREMIVRSARVLRQNPAYRPAALLQPPMLACRGLLLSEPYFPLFMKHSVSRSILILLASAGCMTTRLPGPASPSPATPQPVMRVSDTGPWTFSYVSDTLRLQISRTAAIESQTDSAAHREISTNDTHEVLALTVNSDTVRYTATVDSFSTASQGLIGNTQPANLPVQISGSIDSMDTAVDSVTTPTCYPIQSNLETDVRNVLVSFPRQLTPGLTWRDSTIRVGCYGTIPLRVAVIRQFSVIGKTSFNDQAAITIQRVDSIIGQGAGRQQQHQLVIETRGTGAATYMLNPEVGRLLHLTTTQDLEFSIRASGRTNRFRETAKEEFNPVR